MRYDDGDGDDDGDDDGFGDGGVTLYKEWHLPAADYIQNCLNINQMVSEQAFAVVYMWCICDVYVVYRWCILCGV